MIMVAQGFTFENNRRAINRLPKYAKLISHLDSVVVAMKFYLLLAGADFCTTK